MIGVLVFMALYMMGAFLANELQWDTVGTYFLGALFGSIGTALQEAINES